MTISSEERAALRTLVEYAERDRHGTITAPTVFLRSLLDGVEASEQQVARQGNALNEIGNEANNNDVVSSKFIRRWLAALREETTLTGAGSANDPLSPEVSSA